MDVAQAQLSKYSNQLALWTRIDNDLTPANQAPALASSISIEVDPAFVAQFTDTDGDGVLSPAEIAAGVPGCRLSLYRVDLAPLAIPNSTALRTDPEAAALAAALQAQLCAELQLDDCSRVQIQGIGGAPPGVGGSFSVDITSEYQAALTLADTNGDGDLTPAEIAANPDAAAMVAALQVSVCDQLATCTDPSTISISQIANIADPAGTGTVSHNLQLGVTDDFHAHLMEADTNGDGVLEPDEMAAHPTAAAIVEAMQQSICDSIPACTDPSTISIDGITSNAGTGRRMLRSADELVSVTLAQTSVQSFGQQSVFRDCLITDSEIADSGPASSFANALGRVHGKPVIGLRLPGCHTTRSGKISQKLMSERRVTMAWDHWAAMGGNQLPMTREMIHANVGASALAQDFATAACTEFGFAVDQCSSIEVSLLYPVIQKDGSVEVRAAVGGHRDQLMLIAEVESAGR